MKFEPSDIDTEHLARRAEQEYGFGINSLTFLPKGEDAANYVAEGQQGRRYFARAQRSALAPNLQVAFEAVTTLQAECKLPQVVAPYRNRRERYTCRYRGYTVAVFPFVEGRTAYESGLSPAVEARTAELLAQVHRCGSSLSFGGLPEERFEDPFREPILRVAGAAAEAGTSGSGYPERARRLLTAQRADVLSTLQTMEQLGARAREERSEWGLTHGDPNLDNLIVGAHGNLFLTDWGDIGFGPPERDLFAFTGERFEQFLKCYAAAGKTPHLRLETFAFYFYRWVLQEIADYTTRILFRVRDPREQEHAWLELQPYLPVRHDEISQGLRHLGAVLDRALAG